MFIYSVRGSSVRFFAILILVLGILVGALALSGNGAATAISVGAESVKFTGIREKADRIGFLSAFGINVDPESEVAEEFTLPSQFDRVMNDYNEIQKRQMLDLTGYAGKKVTRYTYEVVFSEKDVPPMNADLLVFRNRIIGADVTSVSPEPFVIPVTEFAAKIGAGA